MPMRNATAAASRSAWDCCMRTAWTLAGIHVGYEHNYVLRSGCTLFWQVKSDMMIKGADLLRTGIVLGVKLPIK